MDFQQADQQFQQLDRQYKAGQITLDQYRTALTQLRVTDSTGNLWQLQEITGAWYVFSQGQWIKAVPPQAVPSQAVPPQAAPIGQSGISFQQAEAQFQQIERQFRSNQINIDQYKAALTQLRVTDASNNIWQLQEHTGAWYVFWQGQWVQATPPGSSTARPAQVNPAHLSSPSTGKKPFPWKPVLFGAGGLLVTALLVIGGITLIKSGLPGGQQTSGKVYTFKAGSTVTLKPGESSITDENGTALQVASASLPSESTVAQLSTYSASGDLEKALSDSYTLDTPFYEVSLQGKEDGAGQAGLDLPASNPHSQLLMVIDKQYAVILSESPQDGKFSTSVHLGPTDLSDTGSSDMASKQGSVYYAVVTPKNTAAVPSSIRASNRQPDADSGKDCSPISLRALTLFNRCQANETGSVMVIYPSSSDMTHYDAYNAAKEIEAAVTAYAGKGFTYATLSASSPIVAVVSSGYTSPEYNFKNGIIYLPPDIPVKLATEKTAIDHEVAHLIQNRIYSLAVAKAVNARSWWMDVSAEMMVIDILPEYITGNMSTYGTITSGSALAFQDAPYQWPADFYVHAQLMEVNMCDTGYCPINHDDFVNAINGGRYPMNSSYAQEQLTANTEDYARYLLGFSPLHANTGISLAAVKNQDSYGQIITVTETNKSNLSFTSNGDDPQVKKVSKTEGDTLEINAPLEKDGVYPLQITSGGNNGSHTGLPLMLVVDPGVPFDYRLDGGEFKSSDGSKEERIGPIHAGMGVTTVRLVAYSKSGGQSFQAHLEPVNLEGVWVINPTTLISNSIQCTGGSSDSDTSPDGVAQIGSLYSSVIVAMGDMTQDTTGLSLDWSMVPSRLPTGIQSSDFTYKSSAVVNPDGLELQSELDLPKPTSESSLILPNKFEPVEWALVLVLPAASISLIPKSKKNRRLTLLCILLLMTVILAGCFGIAFYGNFKGDVKITKMEYTGGSGTANWSVGSPITDKPIWTFTEGTGTYPIDFFIEVSTDDANGNTTKSIEECTGTAVYSVTGGIYEDIAITIPNSSSE
jgi:hypothetical protein